MIADRYQIIEGDCVDSMRAMPSQSVHCVVTSPPYYGLRDYGVAGQIGLEATPQAFVAKMVEVFREVRRVLRDDGTLWLNLGDGYVRRGGARSGFSAGSRIGGHATQEAAGMVSGGNGGGLAPKNLIGMPWRVALALQADGWILRSDIIWHKPNPMPESVRDRPSKAHEHIFMFSKRPTYYYNDKIVRQTVSGTAHSRGLVSKRNLRDVWTIASKPFSGPHFATFPPKLIEPCILAGCPRNGTVLDPFGGSGTTAFVAINNHRRAILCELSPKYIALAHKRIASPKASQVSLI